MVVDWSARCETTVISSVVERQGDPELARSGKSAANQLEDLEVSMPGMESELQKLQSFDHIFEAYHGSRLGIAQ